MSRVVARPKALVDGSKEASKIVLPGSDAERYYNEGRTTEKIPSFLGYLSMLSNPGTPRGGYARIDVVANHLVTVIQGEDTDQSEPTVTYGFGISSAGNGEFMEISRLVGQDAKVLSYVDLSDIMSPVFREPDLLGIIEDQARLDELKQILAAGQDAAEWALD